MANFDPVGNRSPDRPACRLVAILDLLYFVKKAKKSSYFKFAP